jgi:hypothetical protein
MSSPDEIDQHPGATQSEGTVSSKTPDRYFFPTKESVRHLIGAILAEINEEWRLNKRESMAHV